MQVGPGSVEPTKFNDMIISCFPAIASPSARILILGSMPGKKSLEMNQYYAHPRNLFWPFMAELLGFDKELDYQQKTFSLIKNKIALWDVLRHCHREGRLDQAIQKDSMIPNDFITFLQEHSDLHSIFFNGKKAEDVFTKLVKPKLSKQFPALEFIGLPSTSPANASIKLNDKMEKWSEILTSLKK